MALHSVGVRSLMAPHSTEGEVRRGISALYYGLFHHLIDAGTEVFGAAGDPLRGQVGRAYGHAQMRKVCERYANSPLRPFPKVPEHLNQPPPDARLIGVADAFVKLQEARHSADYDLRTTVALADGLDLLVMARRAHDDLDTIQHQPATTIFLTALLLDDRWTRRA